MLAEQLLLVDEAWPLLHPAELRGAGLPGFQGKGWRITPLRQQSLSLSWLFPLTALNVRERLSEPGSP